MRKRNIPANEEHIEAVFNELRSVGIVEGKTFQDDVGMKWRLTKKGHDAFDAMLTLKFLWMRDNGLDDNVDDNVE